MKPVVTTAVLAVLWSRAVIVATAHGAMIQPMSRQWLNAGRRCELLSGNSCGRKPFYNPFSLSSVGSNKQGATCGGEYPGDTRFEAGGYYATNKIVATYKAGQQITVKVQIWNNHWGYYQLRLCDLAGDGSTMTERKSMTRSCLQKHVLKKAGSSGRKRWLYTGTPGSTYVVVQRYTLPKGIRCKRCVLQWRYITGHQCMLPDANKRLMLKVQPGSALPCAPNYLEDNVRPAEKFYGCADVRIW